MRRKRPKERLSHAISYTNPVRRTATSLGHMSSRQSWTVHDWLPVGEVQQTFKFVAPHQEFIEELRNASDKKNTKRSTDYWANIFQQWANTREKNEQLESYEVPALNEALAQFFPGLR